MNIKEAQAWKRAALLLAAVVGAARGHELDRRIRAAREKPHNPVNGVQ